MKLNRERKPYDRLNFKRGNVARDRMGLPTRGFSVLLWARDYVLPLVIN